MARRRRKSSSNTGAFGASLLDLMTCGLGALLLLFILKNADSQQKFDSAAEQLEVAQRIADVSSQRLNVVSDQLEKSTKGSPAIPVAFGIPQLSGSLLILVDASGSMFSDNLTERAQIVLRDVIANSPKLKDISVYRFSSNLEQRLAWSSVAKASASIDAIFEGSGASLRSQTNLRDALIVAVEEARKHASESSVLLVSDGIHNEPSELPSQEFLSQLAANKVFRPDGPSVHTVGLFAFRNSDEIKQRRGHLIGARYGCRALSDISSAPSEPAGQRELAEVLRRIARLSGGAFIGIPVRCPT